MNQCSIACQLAYPFECSEQRCGNGSNLLVVHECYAGKRKSEEAFAAVFLSNAAALTESESFWGGHSEPPPWPGKRA